MDTTTGEGEMEKEIDLLVYMLPIASSHAEIMQQSLDTAIQFMFNGHTPGECCSTVCGQTWGPGAIAYRCADCQTTPNSCICVDCFKEGNHEGHDFHLYTSAYGGCCDCGELNAWNPQGFCPKHGGSGGSLSQDTFNVKAARKLLDIALRVLHGQLVSYLRHGDHVRVIVPILDFLSKVCSFGDAPRRTVAEATLSFLAEEDVSTAADRCTLESGSVKQFSQLVKKRVKNGPSSLLDVLLVALSQVRDNVHKKIMKVVMDLNYDVTFKKHFIDLFVYFYPLFITKAYSKSKSKSIRIILSGITSQCLGFPPSVKHLAKEQGFLIILLTCLEDFFQEFSKMPGDDSAGDEGTKEEGQQSTEDLAPPVSMMECSQETKVIRMAGRRLIDLNQDILRADYSPWEDIMSDLYLSLDHDGIAFFFAYGSQGLITKWQLILALLHGMNLNKRYTDQHVEYESNDWHTAFYLSLRILDISKLIQKDLLRMLLMIQCESDYRVSEKNKKKLLESENGAREEEEEEETLGLNWPQIQNHLWEQVRFLLDLVCSDGVEWQTNSLRALYHPPGMNILLQNVRWSSERDGASFHPLLHRNLMALVSSIAMFSFDHEIFLGDGPATVATLLNIKDKRDAFLLLEHPLRCQILLAQIESGMWRRNGTDTMQGQYRLYKGAFFGVGQQFDLLATQCAISLLGAEEFMATVAHRFGVINFFRLTLHGQASPPMTELASIDEQQQLSLAEEFFRFVLEVVTNRDFIAPENTLRKQVIQWLAAGEKVTHSKLVKQLIYENKSNNEVKQILSEVAVFVRPGAGNPGYFQLKPECWSEFNPYFLHFTRSDLNRATENYHIANKGKALLPISTPSVPCTMFAAIDDILRSPITLSLIFNVLYSTSTKSTLCSDSLLELALHLLTLCLRLEKADQERLNAQAPITEKSLSPSTSSLMACLKQKMRPMVEEVVSGQSGLNREGDPASLLELIIRLRKSNKHVEENSYFDDILLFIKSMDPQCKQYIDAGLEAGSSENKAKTARERARERIMAQMRRQQQAFIKSAHMQTGPGLDAGSDTSVEENLATPQESSLNIYQNHPSAECVLCRETKPWSEQPLGLIGTCKRSRILSLANQQPIRLENWRRIFVEQIERQKATHGKGKEKESATLAAPLGVHITVNELMELMELLRAYLEESPLMVSISHISDIHSSIQLLDLLLEAYAREVQESGNNQPITYEYVWRHARDHHETVQSTTTPIPTPQCHDVPETLLFSNFQQTSVLVQSCGHAIHFDCWKGYLETRASLRRSTFSNSNEDMLLSESFQEFWCPQCRKLSNVLIPIVPSSIVTQHGQCTNAEWPLKLERNSYEIWMHQLMQSPLKTKDEECEDDDDGDVGDERDEEDGESIGEEEEDVSEWLDDQQQEEEDLEAMSEVSDSGGADDESPEETNSGPQEAAREEVGSQEQTRTSIESQVEAEMEELMQSEMEELMQMDRAGQIWSNVESQVQTGSETEHTVEMVEEANRESQIESEAGSHFWDHFLHLASLEGEGWNEESRVARRNMCRMASRFVQHMCSIKKYRRRPSFTLTPREHPLFLISSLSYNIAALELALRSCTDPQGDQEESRTDNPKGDAQKLRTVVQHLPLLPERRYTHFKDLYGVIQACISPRHRHRWLRVVQSSVRGDADVRGSKPLLSSEIFPLLVMWLTLEHSAQMNPHEGRPASSSTSTTPSATSFISPCLHVAFIASVTQVLLSLLCYQRSPSVDEESEPEDHISDDLNLLLHLLRSRVSTSRDCSGDPRQGPAMPGLDVLKEWDGESKQSAAQRLLSRRSAPSSASFSSKEDPLSRFVKAHTVPMLRRTALFLVVCLGLPLSKLSTMQAARSQETGDSDLNDPLSIEFDTLAAFLGLPPLESMLFGCMGPLFKFVERWWQHLFETRLDEGALLSIPCVGSPAPFKLIELPNLFQDIFHAYLGKKCPKCNTQPSKPAICLVCGTLLCADAECCKKTRCGECFRHAIMCGAGVGIFLLAKTSGVLLIAEDKCCLWGSPYFDQYGEEVTMPSTLLHQPFACNLIGEQ